MDAAAYLSRQGWRGEGYSLDPKDRGLKKRLLLSGKQGQLGVGKKAYDVAGSQWWQGAFDNVLQGLNSQSTKLATPTPIENRISKLPPSNSKWQGLYSTFVRGSTLGGTLSETSESGAATPVERPSTLRTSPDTSDLQNTDPESFIPGGKHTRFAETRPTAFTTNDQSSGDAKLSKSQKKAKKQRADKENTEKSQGEPAVELATGDTIQKHEKTSRRKRKSGRCDGGQGQSIEPKPKSKRKREK